MDIAKGDIVLCELYFSDLSATKKRPVLVFQDNLPHDDFIGLPISSQIDILHPDEYAIDNSALRSGSLPKKSKLMPRKPFVVAKAIVIKKYGTLNDVDFMRYHRLFCQYFGCA